MLDRPCMRRILDDLFGLDQPERKDFENLEKRIRMFLLYREMRVLEMYYGKRVTLESIAKTMKVSAQRIFQVKKDACDKLTRKPWSNCFMLGGGSNNDNPADSLDILHLSNRCYRVLRNAGINRVSDLRKLNAWDFSTIKGLGVKSLSEIEDAYNRLGYPAWEVVEALATRRRYK